MKNYFLVTFLIINLFFYRAFGVEPDNANRYQRIAEDHKWIQSYKEGKEIIEKLTSWNKKEALDIGMYRDEEVTLVGVGAPPGSTNDLVTEKGFYLRVVTKKGKDLRPHSVWWEVMIHGKILQVLPENKIIVIEIKDEDWVIIQTG
jgi:hypothetical protein